MAALAWEQDTRYQAACRTQVPQGGPTAYLHPRRPGIDAGDITNFQAGQADWSATNLPDILYQVYPEQAWWDFKVNKGRAQQKRDAQGRLMWEEWPEDPQNPSPLLDFPILANINQISTQEHPLILEAWRRLDPRITWKDLLMRMQSHGRSTANKLNMHGFRTWRVQYRITTWFYRGDLATSPENRKIVSQLTQQQWSNNTTRGLTPGLIDPSQGPGSPSVPFPQFGPDEGFPRKPRGPPPGHQGLTRMIDWKPSHVGPNRTIAPAAPPMSTAPLTSAPATSAPATSAPATSAPATSAPATSAFATSAAVTSAPAVQPIAPAPASLAVSGGNQIGNTVTRGPRRRAQTTRPVRSSSNTPSLRGALSSQIRGGIRRRRPTRQGSVASVQQAQSTQALRKATIDEDLALEYFDREYDYNDEDADYTIEEEEEPAPIAPTRNQEPWRTLPVQIGRQIDNPANPFRQPHHTSEYDVHMEHWRRL